MFTFTRIDARREALTVNLSFTQAGDYLPSTVPTTITFEQDELTKQISLAVDDGVDELNGGIILEMSTTDAYEIVGASGSTTVFVTDDDEPQFVTLERDATSVVEGEDATFTLTRHFDTGSSSLAATGQAMEWPLAVSVAVTEQGDFIDGTVPTSVTFVADSSTTTLTVTTDDDARPGPLEEAYNTATRFHSAYENDGSITATVSAGTNYTAGLPVAHRTDPADAETTATLTVQDNEPPLVRATVIPNASDSALRTETFITEGGSVVVTIKRYFYDSDESLTVLLENTDFACYDSQQPGVTPRNHAAAEIPLAESSRAFSATIPVGQDSVVATVVSQDDNAAECSMRWNVDVLPPTRPEGVTETSWMERFDDWDYHPLDPDRASITMGDPDLLPVIAFMSPTVDEDDANAEVVVTLRTDAITSGYVSSWPITLNWWTIEQTAMEVEDFTKLESQTVTFPRDTDGGQSDMSLTIPIVDNHTVESTETLVIGYRLSTDYTNNLDLILRGSAPTITILDNDQIPTIDAETSIEVEESDGVATIFLTLDQPSDTPVTVIWTTENDTAKSGAPPLDDDYDATTMGSFTFNPLATLGQIDIPINDDINDEPAIEQFRVRLQSATNGTVGDALTTVSIIDNDLPPIFSLGGHPFGVREGVGTVVYIVELWHEGRHTVSAKEVTVTVTPVDGSGVSSEASATLDVDYMVPNRTVTIRSGRSTGGLGVNIVHDGIDEPLEFFTLNSDQFVGVRQSRLINYSLVIPIGDIDLPSTISLQDAMVMEPSSTTGTANATVTAVLNKRSAKAITVTYTTRDGTAKSRVSGESVVFGQDDYTPSTGTITFQPGTTSTTFQIPVKGDDYLERNEMFEVVLSSPTNATIADEAGTVTIQDGSRPPVIEVESFSPSDRVSESATDMIVNFSLNHPDDTGLITSGLNATLDYSVVMFAPTADAREAIRGADYLLPATGTVTITPGSNGTTLTIPIVDDAVDEPIEKFIIRLSNPVNATYTQTADRTLTIEDDDPPPKIQVSDARVREDMGPMIFNVSLSSVSSRDVSFDYNAQQGTAFLFEDYEETIGKVKIPAGDTTATIKVSIINDSDQEAIEELFTLFLRNAENGVLKTNLATGRIIDDDQSLPPGQGGIIVSYAELEVAEGDTNGISIDVSLSAAPSGTVDVTLAGLKNTDVTAAPASLTFTDSTWNSSQKLTFAAVDDDDASNDSHVVRLTANGGGYNSVLRTVLVTVIDDDTAGLTVSESSLTIEEGASDSFTVLLTSQPVDEVIVDITKTAPQLVDLRSGSLSATSLTFTSSNWQTAQTVSVEAVEDDNAVNETITLTMRASGTGYADVTESVIVTINDDETIGLVLKDSEGQDLGSAPAVTLTERALTYVTLYLATQPTGPVVVTASVAGSDEVTVDSDSTPGSKSMTFDAQTWNIPQRLDLESVGDDDAVDGTPVPVAFSARGGGYDSLGSPDLEVTIDDDDTAAIVFTGAPVAVTEGDTSGASYTVALGTRPWC